MATDRDTDERLATADVVCQCEIPAEGLRASEAAELLAALGELAAAMPDEERETLVESLLTLEAIEEAGQIRRGIRAPELIVVQSHLYNPWEIGFLLQYATSEQLANFVTIAAGIAAAYGAIHDWWRKRAERPDAESRELPAAIADAVTQPVRDALTSPDAPHAQVLTETVLKVAARLGRLELRVERITRTDRYR